MQESKVSQNSCKRCGTVLIGFVGSKAPCKNCSFTWKKLKELFKDNSFKFREKTIISHVKLGIILGLTLSANKYVTSSIYKEEVIGIVCLVSAIYLTWNFRRYG